MSAGLVRGYANLGMLTDLHWHTAHNIFKARALLYAQRLAVASDQIAWARCHRAYALAACGLHAAALSRICRKRFNLAKPLPRRSKPSSVRRTWIELIANHCLFKNPQLAARANHPVHGELASLLELRTIELTTITQSRRNPDLQAVQKRAKQIHDRMPHCIRARQSLGILSAYDHSHLNYAPQWYQSVLKLPACPNSISKLLAEALAADRAVATKFDAMDEAKLRGKLIVALRDASEQESNAGDVTASDVTGGDKTGGE